MLAEEGLAPVRGSGAYGWNCGGGAASSGGTIELRGVEDAHTETDLPGENWATGS